MPSPADRALQPVREEAGGLTAPQHTRRELDALTAEQYADDASWSEYHEHASIEDLINEGLEPPAMLSFSTAWERENERYRKAGRRRSST